MSGVKVNIPAIWTVFAVLVLGGCAVGSGESVVDSVMTTDLTPRFPASSGQRMQQWGAPPRPEVYTGASDQERETWSEVRRAASEPNGIRAAANPNEGYDLNFENAEVTTVAKAVLGDLLQLTYAVDPRVQGTISLSSGRPIPQKDILPLFESVLKLNSAMLVREGPLYKVVPGGEGIGAGSTERGQGEPGFGISVFPLRYVSAQNVLRTLESFATRPGMVRVDQPRNLVLILGSSTERASAIEAALALDVDWMKNQSVGIFPIRTASPETVITELQSIFDTGKEGGSRDTIQFQPIQRLNAVLVIGQSAQQVQRARVWIQRLDKADINQTMVRVFRLRFGNARLMANILRDAFGGNGGGPGSTSTDLSNLSTTAGASRTTLMGQSDQRRLVTPADQSSDRPSSDDQQSDGSRRPDIAGGAGSGNRTPLLPGVRITADVANNALLIYASREQYKIIEHAIWELDRAPQQVAIEATIAEVTLNKNLEYGIQFFLRNKNKDRSIGYYNADARNPTANLDGAQLAAATLKRLIPGFNAVLGAVTDPLVVIDAFRQLTDVKVLSSPSLVVLDNQSAVLQVGDQVPITTRTAVAVENPIAPVVNSIEMKNTGVILRVTPRINANGVVTLEVEQEVSHVVNPQQVGTNLTPTISQRRVKSSIAVASGQTVLLGGLIHSRQQQGREGLPVPAELNLIGKNTAGVENTELIIFIRPQIMRDAVDAQLVAEELRSRLQLFQAGRRLGVSKEVVPVPMPAGQPSARILAPGK